MDVKTDDLIKLMAEDAPVRMRIGKALSMALAVGLAGAVILLLSTVGLREGMADAIASLRVAFKVAITVTLAVIACALTFRIGRPGVPLTAVAVLLIVPLAMLVVAVIAELSVLPMSLWRERLVGEHPVFCLYFIPLLSVVPLAAFLLALREGAPASPGLAGAAAGLAAGAIAAAVYAWHCTDDSPLFVASWYVAAIAVVTLAGFLIGRRLLRW
jgi:hypothetical protein